MKESHQNQPEIRLIIKCNGVGEWQEVLEVIRYTSPQSFLVIESNVKERRSDGVIGVGGGRRG